MNFIPELLEITKEVETPKKFIKWAALAAISSVLGRRIWVPKRGGIRVYPNLFICLVAKSGLRKSFAPNLAQKMVAESEMTKVMVDRGSIQYMIEDLRNVVTFKSGKMITDAVGFFCSEELNAALIQDPAAQKILTRLYDSNYSTDLTTGTKKDGKAILQNFYLTMFTATNGEHLNDFLDLTSISGGFMARTLIIKADKKENINPLISETEEEDELIQQLDLKPFSTFLRKCENLSGKMRMTNGWRHAYREWYTEFNEQLEVKNSDRTGISERLHDHIIKVCMCLAVSRFHSMELTEDNFEEAKSLCIESASDTSRIVAGAGKSELSAKMRLLIDDLLSAKDYQLMRGTILSRRWGDFDSTELDRMIETFVQSGAVEIIRNPKGPIYRMTAQYVKQFHTLLGGPKIKEAN